MTYSVSHMEDSIFTKIINREIAGVVVWEDEQVIVLMDKFPAVQGQTLVIPKKQIDNLFEVPDELYSHLWLVAKCVAHAMQTALSPRRVCVVVEGFEVPHAHIKLYPVPEGEGLTIKPGEMAEDEELEVLAEKIRKQMQ